MSAMVCFCPQKEDAHAFRKRHNTTHTHRSVYCLRLRWAFVYDDD